MANSRDTIHRRSVIAAGGGAFISPLAPVEANAGTGSDSSFQAAPAPLRDVDAAALRARLGADQAANVWFVAAGDNAVPRSTQDKARDALSLKDFGASGNGSANDTAPVQTAIDESVARGKALLVPHGTYRVENIRLPNNVRLIGESRDNCVFTASSKRSDVFVSGDAADSAHVWLENISIVGGRYGINGEVSSTFSNWTAIDLNIRDQAAACWRVSRQAHLNRLVRVIFDANCLGFLAEDGPSNNNSFFCCEWKEMGDDHLRLGGGSEATVVFMPRHEDQHVDGPAPGATVYRLPAAKSFEVIGGYFENTMRSMLEETSSLSQVWFRGCRFSGQEGALAVSELFTSDGIVGFDNCQFHLGSFGARQMATRGKNLRLDTRRSWLWKENDDRVAHLISPSMQITSHRPCRLAAFTARPGGSGVTTVLGFLDLLVTGRLRNGSPVRHSYSRRFTLAHGSATGASPEFLPGSLEDQTDSGARAAITITAKREHDSTVMEVVVEIPELAEAFLTAELRCVQQVLGDSDPLLIKPFRQPDDGHPASG